MFIDVEREFDEFVPTHKDGLLVRSLMPDAPAMQLNADYYFESAGVVAELKCLESDASDGELVAQRTVRAFNACGLTGSEMFGVLFRGDPMPPEVAQRIAKQAANPIREALRKANKQIRATKRFLGTPAAYGLAIIVSNNNYGLSPIHALSILSEAALKLSDSHVDGFVYATANVYYHTGDDIARNVWMPLYAEGKEDLADFVNPLGRAWIDRMEVLGGPMLDRKEMESATDAILFAKPIKQFKKS